MTVSVLRSASRRTFGGLAGAALVALVAHGCSSDRRFLTDAASDGQPRDVPRADESVTDVLTTGPDAGPDVRDGVALDAVDATSALDAQDVLDVIARDESPLDVRPEGGAEASVDGSSDATLRPSPRCATAPRVDGNVGSDWGADSLRVTNDVVSAWGAGLNELRALRVCYDATSLYLGVEGVVESGNAILAYIDRDFSSASGVGTLSVLQDRTGALDRVLSGGFALGDSVAGFAPEGAWGSVGMASVAPDATSEAAGVRLFFPVMAGGVDRRQNFAYPVGAETRCRTEAPAGCEVAIPWRTLFELPAGGTLPAMTSVALAVRIANGIGDMSPNQTLPRDEPSSPRRIGAVLAFDVRF